MAAESHPHFTPFFSRSQVSAKTVFWVLGTALLMLAAVWVASKATIPIVLTVVSLLVAVAVDHQVRWLMHRGLRRNLAITATMTAVVLVVAALALAVVPAVVRQGTALVLNLPQLLNKLRSTNTYALLNTKLGVDHAIARYVIPSDNESRVAGEAVMVLSNALLVVVGAVTIFFLALFMLIFGPAFIQRLLDEARWTRRPYYERIFRRIYTSLGGYIDGQVLMSSCIGTLVSVYLALIHVPFFLPLGLLCGVLNPIPNIGSAVALVIVALFTFVAAGVWKTVVFVVLFLVYKQIEGQLIGPLVFRRTAAINPLAGTIVILFATELAGVAGALLAIPVLASVQVVLAEVLAIRREWIQREAPEDTPAAARRTPQRPA